MSVPPGYIAAPLSVLDSTTPNTEIQSRISLIFERQLSLNKLEDSWYRLVRTWPILAARVRENSTAPGGLEYHIPTLAKLDELEQHGRQSEKIVDKHIYTLDLSDQHISSYSAIVGRVVEKHGLDEVFLGISPDKKEQKRVTCQNAVNSFPELLTVDQPYVSAQCTLFKDATLVTIACSHCVGDGFSVKQIFAAWGNMLRGTSPEPFKDVGKDPFIEYLSPDGPLSKDSDGKELGPPQGWQHYGLFNKLRFACGVLYDLYIARPEKTIKQIYIYLPQHVVDQLMIQAEADLNSLRDQRASCLSSDDLEKMETAPKLSKFNVLFAWLLQNMHASNPDQDRLSSVLSIVNLKGRPAMGYRKENEPGHPFWTGGLAFPIDALTSRDYTSMSLGQVALHIRTSIQKLCQPENLQKALVHQLKHTSHRKPTREFFFFAPPNHYWSGLSDWRAVKFGDTDFAGAQPEYDSLEKVVSVGASVNRLEPCALQAHMEIPVSQRNRWVCMGDAGGGAWFTGFMSTKEARHPKGFGKYPFVE